MKTQQISTAVTMIISSINLFNSIFIHASIDLNLLESFWEIWSDCMCLYLLSDANYMCDSAVEKCTLLQTENGRPVYTELLYRRKYLQVFFLLFLLNHEFSTPQSNESCGKCCFERMYFFGDTAFFKTLQINLC